MPASPASVLYVDDDRDSREMLGMLLDLSRIETKAVASGKEALHLMQAERFDLYLLDVWLPDFDGLELCQRMRAIDPARRLSSFRVRQILGITTEVWRQERLRTCRSLTSMACCKQLRSSPRKRSVAPPRNSRPVVSFPASTQLQTQRMCVRAQTSRMPQLILTAWRFTAKHSRWPTLSRRLVAL